MGSQKIAGLAGGLIVGAGLLLASGPAQAEWRYTDDKGKTRTVVLKMDVPGQYRNSAVYVDLGARQDEPRRAGRRAPGDGAAQGDVDAGGELVDLPGWLAGARGSPAGGLGESGGATAACGAGADAGGSLAVPLPPE